MENDLRPLGVGEILDRAVTVTVRWFPLLFATLAVVAIPLGLLVAVAEPAQVGVWSQLADLVQASASGNRAEAARIARAISLASRGSGVTAALALASFLAYPLPRTAFFVALRDRERDGHASIADAYRAAVARWPAQLAMAVAFVAIAVVGFFALMLVLVLASVGVTALGLALPRSGGLVLVIVLFVVIMIVSLVTIALGVLAFQVATVTVAIEETNPFRALGLALRRTVAPAVMRRSLLVAVTLMIVGTVGQFAWGALAALAAAPLRLPVVSAVLVTIGAVAIEALVQAFVYGYARDVRIRREGLDLAVAAGIAEPA